MDRRKLWSQGRRDFPGSQHKREEEISVLEPPSSFQVMNFRTGVVSIKIAVLRRQLGEMKNLMVATITPGVISI